MRNIAFFLYNMKNIKKWLRIALLTAIYWKGYIGGLRCRIRSNRWCRLVGGQ